jgi:hypothetical protein
MAKLFAYVPADKAVAIKLRVDKIARLVRTPQDDRTMGQRRADVVCDLLLGTPGNVQVQLQVTVPAAMLMRVDDQPGELAGYGPITPDLARALAGDATWRRLLTDEQACCWTWDARPTGHRPRYGTSCRHVTRRACSPAARYPPTERISTTPRRFRKVRARRRIWE